MLMVMRLALLLLLFVAVAGGNVVGVKIVGVLGVLRGGVLVVVIWFWLELSMMRLLPFSLFRSGGNCGC